jgi:riboflavin kinase/FMN adenylyltransferase
MNVYNTFDAVPPIEKAILALGTFDGMHLAHRHLAEKVHQEAKIADGNSVIISFRIPPRKTILEDFNNAVLTTQNEKTALFAETGLNNLIIMDFTPEISNMNYADFIEFLQTKICIRKILLGYNHHFGKNREGCFATLLPLGKERHFEVEEIEKQTINGLSISSSSIRQDLRCGDIARANKLLGYNYFISIQAVCEENNAVVKFLFDSNKLLPQNGHYAVKANGTNLILTVEYPHLLIEGLESGFYKIEFI